MLNSLRDGQINYGTPNCPSAHVPPHNVVAPIHQNSLHSTETTTPPVVYPWNSNPRLEHLYGFHSRYYNLDFPPPYTSTTNQYVPTNIYGQNVPQCCQPCCRLRSQNIPKTSPPPPPQPPQVLYNPIRPVQPLNRSYKSKKTLKTPCSEQFLPPYIANDLPVKYDTQNCYQQKYGSSYLNNTNYCPPANNLWIPPAANPSWPADRLRPVSRHTGVTTSHDFSREKNHERLQNYPSNPYSNPTNSTHHRPYNYIPPIPDVQNYRPPPYHNSLKNNSSEYASQEHNSRPILLHSNQSPAPVQQYYNAQTIPYSDVQAPNESFKSPQVLPQNSSKSNLNVREFLANWDEGEEENSEKSSETTAPIVVLDCMTVEGDALTKIQEKLNVVSYENLEKVLKENNNPLVTNTESNEVDSVHTKVKPPSKPNFEPIDYTKRETGIIKPFINEKKRSPMTNTTHPDKNYSVNFDGMVAWYGKKNADISSTDLIERLADRIFNLSKSQENDGVSFGTAAYTGQITQSNRSFASSAKDPSNYMQNQHMYGLQHHTDKFIEPSVINKIDCNNDSISRIQSCGLNESKKASTIKSNNINSSCIVENVTKKCLNVTNEETVPWNLHQGSQDQHLNMSLYDHSVIIKPLDFSSLTDETKGNPFAFEKNLSSGNKSNNSVNDQFNKVLNENNNYNTRVSNNQQMDSTNRNFPVIVSSHVHRQEYNGFHESVIQRTGCDKSKHDKVSAQTDFESMNWNISNDLDKIMKNTNMAMEPSCLYDRNNYNILDSMNTDKNISAQWKDNVPCVDLTVNSKTNNNHHDSFFDSWNFIENYENHSSKKQMNQLSNNNEVHNPLFSNQLTPMEASSNKHNSGDRIENETLLPIKNIPNDVSSNNAPSQDVFNLNNRIPDFSDGFELPVIPEPHDYMQFKKTRTDNERRTDGSIFEHLNETKSIRNVNEMTNIKNDQNKSDIVGLPSFKEKEPLAPMLVPPKLNIVKPILRDPSQIYSVIKQKHKYDNACVDNESIVSNKTGNNLRGNHINNFNAVDLKSKYNSVQLNQFDVWSEKFELKSNPNNSSSPVVHCDVEITQFKSAPENRNAPKPAIITEDYQAKSEKLPENSNCNLTVNKMNLIENEKINSNDFLNCLESTKTDDQKYRDTLDEFETSFGFDIHCNNESNKSFHEDIVDKCLEERIKDQIGEHNMNTSNSNITPNNDMTSNSTTQLPFQCDFQSGYLIKNYFDENKNKAIVFDRKQISNDEKSSKTPFSYHSEMEHTFEFQNNKNLHVNQNSEKISDYTILNNINCGSGQIQDDIKKRNSNFINQAEFKPPFESGHKSTCSNKLLSTEKNNLDYLSIEDRHFEFENNKKIILEPTTHCEEIIRTDINDGCKMSHSDSDIHKLSNIRKHSSVNFELNINNTNIFETNSNTTENKTEANKSLELQNIKNSFDSTFHSDNSINIKQQNNFDDKNIYGIENNNCVMYQTQNVEKINEFDFETRIIHNFGMDCSNSTVQEPTSSKKVFTSENQMKSKYPSKYRFEVNNENNAHNLTHFKSTSNVHEINSDVDRNDITQINNAIETDIINRENNMDRIFEVNCGVNIVQEKENHKIHEDFDICDKNAEEINRNDCSTQKDSNIDINSEVENIFENLCDNLTTLNTKRVDSKMSDECGQNCDKFDVSKSQDSDKDQNLKTNNSEIDDEDCKKLKIDECHNEADEKFEDSSLLQDLVNNSTSHLTSTLLQQNTLLEEALTTEVCDTKESNKLVPNKNENVLDLSYINAVHENTETSEEQQSDDFKRDELEWINPNNMQTNKNTTVGTVQGDTINQYKSDVLNAVTNTHSVTHDDGHGQNIGYESSPLSHGEFTRQQKSDINEIENSTDSDSSPLSHVEFTGQQSSEIENSLNSVSSSLSDAEIISQQNNIDAEFENSSNSESSLIDHAESTCQQNSNNVEIESSASSPSSLLNHAESTNRHSNETVEIKELTNSDSNSLNSAEFTCQPNLNNTVEIDDFSNSNSSNCAEPTCQQNFNNNIDDEDLAGSESNLSKYAELIYQQNPNNIVDDEDSACSESNFSIHSEPACQRNFNNDVEAENSDSFQSSSSNHAELTCLQNSNNSVAFDDLACSDSNSSDYAEPTCQQSFNNGVEVEDLASSESNLSNYPEPTCQLNSNNGVALEDLALSESSSSSHVELTCRQNSYNDDVVEDLAISESSSSNHAELTCQQNSYNDDKIENAVSPKSPSSLNHIETAFKIHSSHIVQFEDKTYSKSNSLCNVNSICQQYPHKSIEVIKVLTSSSPSVLNHAELICQQRSSEIIDVEDSIGSGPGSLNNVELKCNQHSKDISEVENVTIKKKLELSENNTPKLNIDLCLNTSKGIDKCIQLPRVKFILKCHRQNMMKSNIFDDEPAVPLKKCKLLQDEQLIARQVLKKKSNFYRPWNSVYRKESVDEPKEISQETVETICSQNPINVENTLQNPINVDNTTENIEYLSSNEKENEVLSSAESPRSNESIKKSNYVENEEIYINACESPSILGELCTPVPSPLDDFQSENQTPEHYGNEEYWDKSLENEYKNVLYKTISKLTKIRVNIRDKFNTRLLARRVNGTKQRKWRRWWRRRRLLDRTRLASDNVGEIVVGDIVAAVKVPAEVLRLNATRPVCKIKVQLPWGRIFNLNTVEDNQKTKDTKIELGPAKIEVRLSQTPGEWQVAACESMTSSKSVVSVRRLVLQRASPAKEVCNEGGRESPGKDRDGGCNSPPENFDADCNSPTTSDYDEGRNSPPENFDADCNSPTARDYDEGCNSSPARDADNDDCNNPTKSYDSDGNSPENNSTSPGGCYSFTEDYEDGCTTISINSSCNDNSSSSNDTTGSRDSGGLRKSPRKLPKIVIRRIGQDNNYTSYVSSSGFEGGDIIDGTRQLTVRLVRDHKLDAMAAEGITTVHLKNNVPISDESAALTHGAKRVRYT